MYSPSFTADLMIQPNLLLSEVTKTNFVNIVKRKLEGTFLKIRKIAEKN
jgi:hypothetical protein